MTPYLGTAVKYFHWDTVMLELLRRVPTLMSLLKQLVKRSDEKKPLLCFLASQLLKARNQHMGLVQRAVSRIKELLIWSNLSVRIMTLMYISGRTSLCP